MPLSAADLAMIGDIPITIRSTAFANVYLRLDGSGVTSVTASGGGTVNCQFSAGSPGPYEKFKARKQADGTYALESAAFSGVYLRMDGTGVTSQTSSGGGTVNCQFGVGAYEKFRFSAQTDGSFSVESATFPGVYLRMDGTGVTSSTDAGGGKVNAQYNANGGIHEKFFIAMADQRLDFAEQHQQQTQWCWAATSVSITAFYQPATTWTQCGLVNAEYGLDNCCGAAGAGAACNKPWYPDLALRRMEHLNQYLKRSLTLGEIGVELAKSAPFCVATYWRGGGGHAVVIRGRFVSNGVEYVSVSDPWDGDSDVTYDNFCNRYKDSGTWGNTYTTKA
ncbi:papain-like cysteine protease family protein [Phytomonospora endophytica]|uniref:Peptidase C39-like domain-containing protein n=1 Tax=Phytomonospora endophytica TaxID=714109 RepID=A0A841FKP9_9ACTN|nr:papain-like cysteine protease family protein [Phytomonospora endophytica]MBB6037911.1 hypothetical protein [Phytomonospora endophytica]GIG68811.1 hypothetical protein Pen01_51060 [Phytomonospora endophytica]